MFSEDSSLFFLFRGGRINGETNLFTMSHRCSMFIMACAPGRMGAGGDGGDPFECN